MSLDALRGSLLRDRWFSAPVTPLPCVHLYDDGWEVFSAKWFYVPMSGRYTKPCGYQWYVIQSVFPRRFRVDSGCCSD